MRIAFLLLLVLAIMTPALAWAQVDEVSTEAAEVKTATPDAPESPATIVAVIPIVGTIDFGLQKSLERRKNQAIEAGATVLIFEMDSYGGHLDAGIEISDLINNIKSDTDGRVKTVAYVYKKAISAGAMISLACQEIVMRRSTTIGDCQAIMVDPSSKTMKEAPEKIQTNVRAVMRKYAASNGYPVIVCVAMVDPGIEAYKVTFPDGKIKHMSKDEVEHLSLAMKEDTTRELIIAEGKLLTMHDAEAHKWGLSRATVKDVDEAVSLYATAGATVTRYDANWSEEMVRFLNSMAVTSLLMTVGMISLYMAFKMPGMGAPEAIAVCCFVIVFFSKYMVGLADAVEVTLFGVGIILLVLELFVIPGFGITGVSGFICILASLILASQKFVIPTTTFQWSTMIENMLAVFGSMTAATFLFMILLRFLPKTPFLNKLILNTAQEVSAGHIVASAEQRDLTGATGVAVTTLRPVGKAEIDGQTIIVMAESEFIENGEAVIVTKVEGNRIVVTKKA